jgi:hypothetical protein
MRDPYAQREDERAREDDEDARRLADEQADRMMDHAPARYVRTAACDVGDHHKCPSTTALGENCECSCHGGRL